MSGDTDEIILEIENVPITCNRQDLTKNSDYFKAMLEGSFIESGKKCIKLEGVDLKAMNIILHLLWDEHHIVDKEDILLLLQTSCMLQFIKIKNLCIERITKILSPDNCLRIWHITEQLGVTPLDLKAKSVMLMDFSEIKGCDYLLELSLTDLCNYLGSVYLQCDDNEFDVFHELMRWWYEHRCEYENSVDRVLLKLLSCLSYKNLSPNDISEMQLDQDIANSMVNDILGFVSNKKNGEDTSSYSESIARSGESLLKSKMRIRNWVPCILSDTRGAEYAVGFEAINWEDDVEDDAFDDNDDSSIGQLLIAAILDKKCGELKKTLFLVGENKILKKEDLDGFKLTSHEQFIFLYGGEFSIGSGNWNMDLLAYDIIREEWKLRSVLPFKRRHFESCICGDFLYIIGGTGSYRILQDNMYWYNFKEDKWSKEIHLPCLGRNLRCCCFENKFLLVVNLSNMDAYIFHQSTSVWSKLKIEDPRDLFPHFTTNFSVFSCNEKLYIKTTIKFQVQILNEHKIVQLFSDLTLIIYHHFEVTHTWHCKTDLYTGSNLVELKKTLNSLIVTSSIEVPCMQSNCEHLESMLFGDTLYTLYKQLELSLPPRITLELFNMVTGESSISTWHEGDVVDMQDGQWFFFGRKLELFNIQYWGALVGNCLVNDSF